MTAIHRTRDRKAASHASCVAASVLLLNLLIFSVGFATRYKECRQTRRIYVYIQYARRDRRVGAGRATCFSSCAKFVSTRENYDVINFIEYHLLLCAPVSTLGTGPKTPQETA